MRLESQKRAFGAIDSQHDPVPVDFMTGHRSVLKKRPKPVLALAQPVGEALDMLRLDIDAGVGGEEFALSASS
jgi:hypothetical protein